MWKKLLSRALAFIPITKHLQKKANPIPGIGSYYFIDQSITLA